MIENPVDAIFCAMNDFDVPWKDENIATQLDIHYLMNVSGQKNISNMVTFFVNTETGKIDDEDMVAMIKVILSIYLERWTKLYATFSFEYDPISNYDMEENMINDTTQSSETNNDSVTYNTKHETTYGKHETLTNNLQSETEYGKTDTTTNNLTTNENGSNTIEKTVSGFNSSEYSPLEKEEQTTGNETTNTGTQTLASTGSDTETNTGTQETINSGKDTDTNTGSDTTQRNKAGMNIRNYTLKRKGNIGVTTSQDMIKSERELWMWDFFHTVVFPDIDRIITLPYYGGV